MKTFTYYKCKSIAKKIGVLGLTTLMIASCGSDSDNKTNSATNGISNNVPVGTSPIFGDPNSGGSSANLTTWNNLKGQIACNNGNQGRMQDLTFTVTSQGNYGAITGYLQQGSASGSSQGSYYGRSQFGDLMFVNKISNGSNQVSYNIAISHCIYKDHIAEYIGPNAGMTNFYIQNLQFMQYNNTCSSGNVASAYVGFTSQQINTGLQYFPVSNGNQCF